MVNMEDIKNTGRIIAKLIEKLKSEEVEELLCF
jgi:endoglucanase